LPIITCGAGYYYLKKIKKEKATATKSGAAAAGAIGPASCAYYSLPWSRHEFRRCESLLLLY